MKNKIFGTVLILVTVFVFVRWMGWLDVSAAKINVADVESNIYWQRPGDGDDPYPLTSLRTRSNFEDGGIHINPDYKALQEEHLSRHSFYQLNFDLLDGTQYVTESDTNTYEVCSWLEDVQIDHIKNDWLEDSLHFEIKGKFKVSRLHDSLRINDHYLRAFKVKGEVHFSGFYTEAYLHYKLEQIYIEFYIWAMTQQLSAYDIGLRLKYADILI